MKKRRILLLFTIGILLFILCACQSNASDEKNIYTVTFQYDYLGTSATVNVEAGKSVSMPTDPVRKNYIFIGWFTHPLYGSRFDFSQDITENTVLYPRFELDAANITNEITKNIMQSIVKIECRSYKTFLGIPHSHTDWSQGSGFCFSAGNGYYYILTNCHVVCKEPGYDRLEINVSDYKGNEYKGYLYNNPNKRVDAISAEYDLACIYFQTKSTEVKPLTIVGKNPQKEDDVISLGAPKAQTNAITFGKVNGYQAISLDNTPTYESNVTFHVISHSARINDGSSGGPLLNSDLQVIGANYASNQGSSRYYAIPAEKIQEFLKKYVYN
jgi:S1-C subfamily serine protease